MKIKDLSNKIGGRTKGFVEIKRGDERLTQTTFNTLCHDRLSMLELLEMTVNFFNIEIIEKGDIYMTVQVR